MLGDEDSNTETAIAPHGYQETPPPPWVVEDTYAHCIDATCVSVQAGDSVELLPITDSPSTGRSTFFRVRRIIRNLITDEIWLQGWHLERTYRFGGMLPNKLNECCMTISIVGQATLDTVLDVGTEAVPIHRVFQKRMLNITNRPFPEMSFRRNTVYVSNASDSAQVRRTIEGSSELAARWIQIAYFDTERDKEHKRTSERVLRRLKEVELRQILGDAELNDCIIEDSRLLRRWIGKLPGGTTLTFGDAFSGCGGVSQGAYAAGLEVLWGCDNDERTWKTYELNLPVTVELWRSDVQDLISLLDCLKVDILHVSPPCQPFSPANTQVRYRHHTTKGGMNDEQNQAALFCIPALLKKVRPRVVTGKHSSRHSLIVLRLTFLLD